MKTRILFLLCISMILLSSCAKPAVVVTQATTDIPSSNGITPTPIIENSSTPAPEEPVAAPTAETNSNNEDTPVILPEQILSGTPLLDLKKYPNPGNIQVVADSHGTLHVIWSSIHQLFHLERDGVGNWSEPAAFSTSENTNGKSAWLITRPDGQACLIWLNSLPGDNAGFQIECYIDLKWAPADDLKQQLIVLGPLAKNAVEFQAQFDPTGQIQVVMDVRGSETNEDGHYLNNQLLFPNEIRDLTTYHFLIDPHGSYHIWFERNGSIIYRVSNDQGQTWQEPAISIGETLNEGYGSLAPEQDIYFHFTPMESQIAFWISSQPTPSSLPLFNNEKLFEKIKENPGLSNLFGISSMILKPDRNGQPHFLVRGTDGIYHALLQEDGSWILQKISNQTWSNPTMLFGEKNEIFFFYQQGLELFFAIYQ